MPTPSKPTPDPAVSTWSPDVRPRRSIFGNYGNGGDTGGEECPQSVPPGTGGRECPRSDDVGSGPERLQGQIDRAIARAFIYQYLARAFEDPSAERWEWLSSGETLAHLQSAIACLGFAPEGAKGVGQLVLSQTARLSKVAVPRDGHAPGFQQGDYESFLSAYFVAFGHAARGQCPLNEIEYGDFKADPLFQPHRLADLAGFYRAFGMELSADADERHDHICLELEFMCVLSAREAWALEHQADPEELQIGRDAQRSFLREHLGRWVPAFARRLSALVPGTSLAALAEFTGAFVEAECARVQVPCGSQDLLLRPVDDAAESLCASCAASQVQPGAGS